MINKDSTLDEIQEEFKGRGGGPEAESILVDANADRKEGYVSLWTNKKDAAKVLERCKKDVIKYEVMGDGVQFYIDRKSFRGIHCAFRRSK